MADRTAWTTFRTLGLIGSLRYTRVKWLTATEGVFPITRLGTRFVAAPGASELLRIRRGTDDLAGYACTFLDRTYDDLLPSTAGERPLVIDANPGAGFAAVALTTTTATEVVALTDDPGLYLALRKNTAQCGDAVCCERTTIHEANLDALAASRSIAMLRLRATDAVELLTVAPNWLARVQRIVVDEATSATSAAIAEAGYTIDLHTNVLVVHRTQLSSRRAAA